MVMQGDTVWFACSNDGFVRAGKKEGMTCYEGKLYAQILGTKGAADGCGSRINERLCTECASNSVGG